MAQSPYLDQNAPEILALERQKKLADLLQSRALEQPQGQMISGRYVAPSLLQQLAPLANAYMGRKAGEDVESRQAKLANLIRGQNVAETKDIFSTMMGQPEVVREGSTLGDEEGNVLPFNKAAVAPDKMGALMKALNAQSPGGQALAPQLMSSLFKEDTPLILPEGGTAINRLGKVIATGKPKEEKLYSVDNNLVKADGTVVFQGKGKPIPVGNYLLSPEGKIIFKAEKEYAPHAPQLVDTPEGFVTFNPNTNAVTPVKSPTGEPMMGAKNNLTESQGNATAFGMRMSQSNKIIEDLAEKGVNTPAVASGLRNVPLVGGALGSAVNILPGALGGQTPDEQRLIQAKTNFITAVLRKESGAAIGKDEYATEDNKYFPKLGDSQAVIDQKADARRLAIKAIERQAGPGARDIKAMQTQTPEIDPEIFKYMTPEQQALFKKKKP
jgi:hypothetical protein